jgi:NAD-dependent dihydropyrimidine dehydrogenase PreA subunit
MASVITEICLGEQYAACVAACPVDAIYPGTYKGELFMVIDPDTCISCGSCIPQCPIKAIVESEDLSPEWAKVNKELAPQFKNNPKVEPRPANDPPKKPGHKLQ